MSDLKFKSLWDDYANKVVPRGASEVQVTETRRAFYAGGISLFRAIVLMLDPGTEPTEADLQRLTDLQAEFDAYAHDLAEQCEGATEIS